MSKQIEEMLLTDAHKDALYIKFCIVFMFNEGSSTQQFEIQLSVIHKLTFYEKMRSQPTLAAMKSRPNVAPRDNG